MTALYVAERAKNAELARKLKAYESSDPETIVFECVGVENANDYKVVCEKEHFADLSKMFIKYKGGKIF